MSLLTAAIAPGQALGFLVLGASLHDVLTRLKAEPQRFPKLDVIFEQAAPVTEAVILHLPANGIRMRFDGPEQRLRLIEVLDFTKSHLTYKEMDVLRQSVATASIPKPDVLSGPTFRHIYNRLLGPTFPGEFVPAEQSDDTGMGMYVLSYPGIAFSFPLLSSTWSTKKDFVSLLSSSSQPAASMAIFYGDSWPDARERLYTHNSDPREIYATLMKGREQVADEVRLVKIHGEGRLELIRPEGIPPFWIKLGSTSPQELVAVLGPPDAIYRKNDQRMLIHKGRPTSRARQTAEARLQDDSTDTDQSSIHTTTDDSEDDQEYGEVAGKFSGECFYNYFYHGFDILLAKPIIPSQCPPSTAGIIHESSPDDVTPADMSNRLVATKVILHGNVPGSYPFNRHRRCRWEIDYLKSKKGKVTINSESEFKDVEKRLNEEWKSIYPEVANSHQRGMVLNRDWGDSPGSSCELLGGWEDSLGGKRNNLGDSVDVKGLGNTTLFGFPGLVFEVLKNDTISGVTVF